MSTEFQFSVFKDAYCEENERYTQLGARAKFYLTVETFYLAALAFKFKDVQEFAAAFGVPVLFYVVAGALLVVALLLTVLATRIRVYEAPYDLRAILKAFDPTPPTDPEFIIDRMADCVVATERNRDTNNRVAGCLEAAAWLLFAAVGVHFSTFLWAYIHQLKP